jgi:hypothetical protein
MKKYALPLLIVLFGFGIVFAQTQNNKLVPTSAVAGTSKAGKSIVSSDAETFYQQTVALLEQDLERLREHSSETERISAMTMTGTTISLGLMAAIFTIGTVFSLVQQNKAHSEAKAQIELETTRLLKKAEHEIAADLKQKLEVSDLEIKRIRTMLEQQNRISQKTLVYITGKHADCQMRLTRVQTLGFKNVIDCDFQTPNVRGDIYVIDREGLDTKEFDELLESVSKIIPNNTPMILYTGIDILSLDQRTKVSTIGISAISQNLFSFIGNVVDAIQFVA